MLGPTEPRFCIISDELPFPPACGKTGWPSIRPAALIPPEDRIRELDD